MPTATPTPSGGGNSSKSVGVGNGQINGQNPAFTGGIGTVTGTGDYPAGGHGPLDSTFGAASIPCLETMYGGAPTGPGIHVHAFLGIMFNGKQMALPAGIGIANPAAPGNLRRNQQLD